MGKQAIKLKLFDLAHEYPQVLLMGNGPCRSVGQKSCETLIRDISNQYSCSYGAEQLEKLTFPMRVVAASNDHVNDAYQLKQANSFWGHFGVKPQILAARFRDNIVKER